MTTGEKLAALRKRKGITQEYLAEILKVSRQSVSRWEMDAAFPETEKLIRLSRLLECSIDFLLNDDLTQEQALKEERGELSPEDCFAFIRECGYFFLATSAAGRPSLRPMGMIYADDRALYLVTDRRKRVYEELMENPQAELASYNLYTRKWIRISGRAEVENARKIREAVLELYPMIRQEYLNQDEIYFVIFRIVMETAKIKNGSSINTKKGEGYNEKKINRNPA